jgi:hypothetical protein
LINASDPKRKQKSKKSDSLILQWQKSQDIHKFAGGQEEGRGEQEEARSAVKEFFNAVLLISGGQCLNKDQLRLTFR